MKTKITVAVLFLLFAAGCATCPQVTPTIVEVPVPVMAPPLPMPDTPEWKSPDADPANPNEYVRALVYDLIEAWKWGTEMQHVIDSHNRSLSE